MNYDWIDPFICQYQLEDTTACRNTLESIEQSSRWYRSGFTYDPEPESRTSDQLNFSADCPPPEQEPLLDFAQECLDHYQVERPCAANGAPFSLAPEGYFILRYRPGQAYHHVHADMGWPGAAHRHLTMCLYLNTVPEGGETEFVQQGIKVSPVEGAAVIFPATWTHSHRSLVATTDRYVFNLFWGFGGRLEANE